ncbi:nitrite reductase small subunit NirD [Allokutzneria albata]|uniref:Nitrite reductase (NADH) small subunit n=1 Tax=Allokutzneria albata TaxID=211114 RepID=A0A1G9YHI8_ALLAB|nr:nitrite reductase small subunit NirD [Allokutzneria albata]SDN07923.1 nitrite reductase (NADH) small subunit [Allokutzneria albata]
MQPLSWIQICGYDALWPDRGSVTSLPDGAEAAVFRTFEGFVRAVGNLDPATGAPVLSRGIIGDRRGRLVVISPMRKQAFDLETGECVDDPELSIPVYPVRVVDGTVELGMAA